MTRRASWRYWNPFWSQWHWIPGVDFLADSAHFFSGALIVHVLGLHWGLWVAWGVLLGYAIPKEFVWDQYMEPDPVVWDGLVDLLGYCVGGAFGTALLLLWR